MKCTFCGAELNDDVMFCTECGRAIEATSAEPAEAIAEKNPGKVPGIISMILGILAIVLPSGIFPFIMAIVAIVLGSIAGKKSKAAGYKNTMAKVGKILGIIEIIAEVLVTILILAILAILIVLSIFSPSILVGVLSTL